MSERTQHVLVDQRRPFGWRGWIYRSAVDLAAALGRVFLFWHVTGTQHIPRSGPVLVVANHPSYLDPPTLVATTIYYADRDLSIMAWDKLFHIPLVAFFTRTYKAYPVNRENPGRGPYVTLVHILKQGGIAGVFPEGSRSRERLMGTWKPGALRAAFATEATILPITFLTAGEFWPRSRWRPWAFRRHEVIVHAPIEYSDYAAGMPEGAAARQFQDDVSRRIQAIINEPIVRRQAELADHRAAKAAHADPFASQPPKSPPRRQFRLLDW